MGLRSFLQNRKHVKLAKQESKGFDWAAGQLLAGVSAEEVLSHCEAADSWSENERAVAFDKGAIQATDMWIAMQQRMRA